MSEFPNCEIKLCDLEVSRVIQDHEEIREIIGTPDYVGKKGDKIFYWFLRGINIFSAWDPCLWTNQSGCRHLVTRSARLCSPHWLLTIRRSVSSVHGCLSSSLNDCSFNKHLYFRRNGSGDIEKHHLCHIGFSCGIVWRSVGGSQGVYQGMSQQESKVSLRMSREFSDCFTV